MFALNHRVWFCPWRWPFRMAQSGFRLQSVSQVIIAQSCRWIISRVINLLQRDPPKYTFRQHSVIWCYGPHRRARLRNDFIQSICVVWSGYYVLWAVKMFDASDLATGEHVWSRRKNTPSSNKDTEVHFHSLQLEFFFFLHMANLWPAFFFNPLLEITCLSEICFMASFHNDWHLTVKASQDFNSQKYFNHCVTRKKKTMPFINNTWHYLYGVCKMYFATVFYFYYLDCLVSGPEAILEVRCS